MKSAKKIKVIYSKLGRQKAFGQTDEKDIEIDERITGKKHLEIMIHEMLHVLFPTISEKEIIKKSILMTNTLWDENYRRTDLANYIPMQDGTK